MICFFALLYLRKQSGITISVHPSKCIVSVTPNKRLN